MPAENHVEITGNLTKDAEQQGNRPARFRIASYCRGTGDDRVTAFIGIAYFLDDDGPQLDELTRGTKVKVTGRFDPWTPRDSQNQVLDVMAETVEIVPRDGDRQSAPAAASTRRRQPAPDEQPF
jgi:RPA family protein